MIKHCRIYVLFLFSILSSLSPFPLLSENETTHKILNPEEIPLPPSLREAPKNELPREDNFMKEFMNMMFTLGSIIALLLLASYFLKRVTQTRIQQMNESSLIKILERRTISPKTTVYLLGIKDREYTVVESHSGLLLLPENESK